MKNHYENREECPIADAQKIIHGKWTMVVIYLLSEETLRFSELKRKLPHVSEANLTKELRLLEHHNIIHREVYREVPPKVEYSLTELGRKFKPVLKELEIWGIEYHNHKGKNK